MKIGEVLELVKEIMMMVAGVYGRFYDQHMMLKQVKTHTVSQSKSSQLIRLIQIM